MFTFHRSFKTANVSNILPLGKAWLGLYYKFHEFRQMYSILV